MRRTFAAGLVVVLALVALLALPLTAHAATKYVATNGSDISGTGTLAKPYRTIQHAIDLASSGDVIHVDAGSYTGRITMKDGVSLEATGAGTGVYRAELSDTTNVASVVTADHIGADTHVSGFKIDGEASGFGINCAHSSLVIADNWVTGNLDGIYCVDSSPTISDCDIRQNTGSGIVCNASAAAILGNYIQQNHAYGILCTAAASPNIVQNNIGGNWTAGVECVGSSPSITSNQFGNNSRSIECLDESSPSITGNTFNANNGRATINCENSSPSIVSNIISAAYGDGIGCYNGSSPIIVDVALTLGSAGGDGIHCENSSSPAITDCTIVGAGNHYNEYGIVCYYSSSPIVTDCDMSGFDYGIWCTDSSSPTLTGCAISGSTTPFACRGSSPTVVNCTISGGDYESVFFDSSSATFINDTIAGNGGRGIECVGDSSVSITNCIVWNPDATAELTGCTATYSDVRGGAPGIGNIDLDPSFVSAPTGDFHLNADSPCIDMGTSAGAPTTDKDATPRPLGGDWDMGAYEYHPATCTLHYQAADARGSIVGVATQVVPYGGSGESVTALPAVGHHLEKWNDDSTANPRTDTYVTADATYTATFAIDYHRLSYTTNEGGSIEGLSTQILPYGSNGSQVTAVPDTANHYHFVEWSDGAQSAERWEANVITDASYTAEFDLDKLNITVTPCTNGTITSAGGPAVGWGLDKTFAITPNKDYHVVDVVKDGLSIGAVSSVTFERVTEEGHTIAATFAKTIIPASISRTPNTAAATYRRRSGVAKFTLSATIKGWGGKAIGGSYVYLQSSKNGRSWSNTYKIKTSSAGKASKAFRVKTKQVRYYRWYAPAKSGVCLKNYSKPTKVTVK